ncbi:MAG: SUMF1/EgtB/PvdO family nonheme iron enzyme [Luminiphilus sp.]|nr:SUMF1/EgtB/PvdO family nonheme iron enzyme [Luminiphilus sp.]
MSDARKQTEPLSPTAFEPRSDANVVVNQRMTPTSALLLMAGLFIAYILFFLLTARSVSITVESETAPIIDLSGLHLPFGERFLMRPGSYELTVMAEGYQAFTGPLLVDDSEVQTQAVVLTPLPGTLIIESIPASATVSVNGVAMGVTPLTIDSVDAGDVTVGLVAERYLPFETIIQVTGRAQTQRFSSNLTPGWARVSLQTTTPEVSVRIDQQSVTDLPLSSNRQTLEVMEGSREITFSAPGYIDEIIELDAVADTDVDLGIIELIPAAGMLRLTSVPAGAVVTRDGRFVGATPVNVPMEPAKRHRIQVSRAGYLPESFSLALEKGASFDRQVVLSPALGEVDIQVTPRNATIQVNGDDRGKGSQILALPGIEQVITIRAPGYASVEKRVTPRAGLKQRISVALLTEEEARKAAIKPEITSSVGQTLLLIDPQVSPVNEFTMGAPRRDAGRGANEVERPVRLTRAFYMATTEVTNAQFRQFTANHESGQAGGKSLNREHQPAVQLSWQQAASFCNWLSAREGLAPFYTERDGIITGFNSTSTGYRLPTEAEWAFATRVQGEGIWRFAWGEAWPPEDGSANLADASSALVTGRILNGYTDNVVVSAEVGKFPPNPRGLYDMGGNVAEWVNDVYRIPVPNEVIEENPLGDPQGDNYTIRGASWSLSRLRELRLTYRDYGERGRDDVGFRVARYAE